MNPSKHSARPGAGAASAEATMDPRLEALSSLVDGELDPREAGDLIAALCSDPQLRARWTAFHAVGDALRSSEVAATHSAAFCTRLRSALEQEPAILAPRNLQRRSPLRRFLAPGLAVAASAAVIGFVAVPLMRSESPSTTPSAVVSRPAAPDTAVATAVTTPKAAQSADADARRTVAAAQRARPLDAYLVAHRELMGGAALPRATPYLRNAGEQPEGR